jgi:hypothetical protein
MKDDLLNEEGFATGARGTDRLRAASFDSMRNTAQRRTG